MSQTAGTPPEDAHPVHLGDAHQNTYLANERTYLAWTRTALSLLGFGVTIAKVGWDLANLRNSPDHGDQALLLGGALIAASLLIILLGFFRYTRTVHDIGQGVVEARSAFATALAVGGVIGCLVLLAYLWTVAHPG
jgi:putative membrane protein